jgi:signal transduction histidine kinase
MKNIFEPFVTLNANQDLGKHIGLGLTIAKSIIELHKGSIAVSESIQLGGARFIIKLPR